MGGALISEFAVLWIKLYPALSVVLKEMEKVRGVKKGGKTMHILPVLYRLLI